MDGGEKKWGQLGVVLLGGPYIDNNKKCFIAFSIRIRPDKQQSIGFITFAIRIGKSNIGFIAFSIRIGVD